MNYSSIVHQYDTLSNIEENEKKIKENIEKEKDSMIYNFKFKIPLEYHEHKELSEIVKADLEINKYNENNILTNIYKNKENFNDLLLDKYSSLYSTNKNFLKENQKFIKKLQYVKNNMNNFIDQYLSYKTDPDFCNKYQYIQIQRFNYLNYNSSFLHCLGMYNFCTPLFSLIGPIIGLILPYFFLWIKGINVSFSQYYFMVKKIVFNSVMLKGLLNFHKNSMQTNAYTLASIFFYCMSIYHNFIACYNFYNNVNALSNFIENYNNYLIQGKELIQNTKKQINKFKYFTEFYNELTKHENQVNIIQNKIHSLCLFKKNISKYGQLGILLKQNYEIHHDETYHETIMFLLNLNQFIEDMSNVSLHIKSKKLNSCKFIKNNKVTKISNSYYLPLINKNKVKNNVEFKKNIIITGPNASGKTTIIKSCLINLFLSQSIGFGCYDNCKTRIYDYFHSYLNIPDTSNRDSLFQSEARRCKEIINFVEQNNKKNHFCIFDEIYSGTNPNDAVLCASIYLKGMNLYKKNADFMLTTHYIDLCEKFKDNENIENMKMDTIEKNNKFEYLYTLVKGISKINGGFQILVDLNYPQYLLDLYE